MKQNTTAEPVHDLGTLAEEARALLAATADAAGEKVKEARERLSAALERSREALDTAKVRAADAAKATDKAIRKNPYQAIGIAFGVGALFAFLLKRR
ncbi:MAG: DUF883 family protein [Verrucomicrobiota bacterium]